MKYFVYIYINQVLQVSVIQDERKKVEKKQVNDKFN